MTRTIRVLVVDDSPLIRELISEALTSRPEFEIVAVASNGLRAVELAHQLQPDVITLDLQMPRMDGLTALDRILSERPTPVVVVSSLTQRGADITLQALDQGALDYVAKPAGRDEVARVFGDELPAKLRLVAGADVPRILQHRRERKARIAAARETAAVDAALSQSIDGCIAIGVSTGGPPALATMFADLAPPMPPVVVVQHMPAMFTGPFASRLDSVSSLRVKEAEDGEYLEPNCAYVAPGGRHLALTRRGERVRIDISDGEPVSGHKPSVDVMMASAARAYGRRCVGVIMTGMGRDGSDGCGEIRKAGGYVLGQDELTSDVYGMNKVAFVEGRVDRQLPLNELATAVAAEARRRGAADSRRPAPVG